MTICGLANIDIDRNKKEISVFSKHELPQEGSKIVGVVSVLLVQQSMSIGQNKKSSTPDSSFGNRQTLGSTSYFNQSSDADEIGSQKLEVPSSLSVIDLPLSEIFAKNFPLSFPRGENQEKSSLLNVDSKQQQINHCDETPPKNQTLSTHKVIVDLSGESVGSRSVRNDHYSDSDNFQQQHSQFKLQSPATSGNQTVRPQAQSTYRPNMKFPNKSQQATKCVDLSCPRTQHERLHSNHHESGVTNIPSKSSQQAGFQRNTRSIILKRRGLDLHCFVCFKVFESYRQVGEHCRMHNLKQQCPVCRAKFSASSNMKRHCLAHFSHALFPCSFCKATFRRKDNLRTHMLRHIHKNSKKNEIIQKNSNLYQNDRNLSESKECEKDISNETLGAENIESVDHMTLESVDIANVPIKQEKEMEDMMVTEEVQNQETVINLSGHTLEECSPETEKREEEEEIPRNKERIVNYNCSSCGLEFSDMQSIRKHVIRYHAEQVNPGTSGEENQYTSHDQDVYQVPEMVLGLPTEQNESGAPDLFSDTPLISNKISFSNQSFDQSEVIDIENLSQVSNGETSQSTVSSEQSSFSGPELFNEAASLSEPSSSSGQPKRSLLGHTALLCSICKQYLQSGDAITEHQTMHADVMGKKLWCVVCGTHFSSKDCLRRHINNHIGNRFQCPLCSSVYSRKDNLKKHVKDVHQYHYDKSGSIRPL